MAWRRQHLPVLEKDWSFGNPAAMGDGIRAGEKVGGSTDLLDEAWWFPAICWPDGRLQFMLNERMMPSQFVVNGDGKRFINEAAPYMDFAHAMIDGQHSGVTHIPCWLITDIRSFHRYVVGGHLPIPKVPFAPVPTGWKVPKAWLESGVVKEANSFEELADQDRRAAGASCAQTADRFNELARKGHDDDFNRGDSAYDNYYGDPTLPNPNLHPLGKPPYYAFQIILGDLGTSGGLRTDEFARVLRDDDSVVKGLYAVGNTSAAVMGRSYAGAGATIGPAMTFGYVAAKHIADHMPDRWQPATDSTLDSIQGGNQMKISLFYEFPLPRPWSDGRRAQALPGRPRRGGGRRQGRLLHGLADRAPLPRGVLPLHRAGDLPGRSEPAHQGHSARLRHHAPAAGGQPPGPRRRARVDPRPPLQRPRRVRHR